MMFDPPDFPYKELTDTIRDQYGPDALLFNTEMGSSDTLLTSNKNIADIAEQMIANVENQLFHSNNSGKYFDVSNSSLLDINNDQNIGSNNDAYVIHSNSNIFNYESTLLDDNTVNQFLLPLSENNKSTINDDGPDLLALHSCMVCHEIFTNDADLLDHTISLHATEPFIEDVNGLLSTNELEEQEAFVTSTTNNNLDLKADWLVCGICERVLSTAVEVEPSEPLCCLDKDGKNTIIPKRLDTMYVCDNCSGLFSNSDALDRHKLGCIVHDNSEHYKEQPDFESSIRTTTDTYFNCNLCRQQFDSTEKYMTHKKDCHDTHVQVTSTKRADKRSYTASSSTKLWNCGSCNQLFATARELYRHKRGEDRPPGAPVLEYECDECDKVLGSMCALHTHKKMHKVSKPGFPCRICGRRFNQSGHLAIHMRMHTGERPYPCDLCPKAFKVKVERDDHRRTHTGERPFACPSCPKTFTAAARLREHARIHTDQRPYICEICGAAFRRPYARTVHILIHTGAKPHECDVCGTAFRRSGDMWKHKRTLHGIQSNNSDVQNRLN